MRIPLHNVLNNFNPERSIYNTKIGEIRYFIIDGEDTERRIRVTGTPSGGLRVEEDKDGEYSINTTALPRLGDSVQEVPEFLEKIHYTKKQIEEMDIHAKEFVDALNRSGSKNRITP